ncbi:MAG TPA: cation-translocating P-type ATPase [Candidatus Saccharimonadales bacterium]|nr:cation-translocating P-type ATPase [Candidatus Saccharimonadales bacterium]
MSSKQRGSVASETENPAEEEHKNTPRELLRLALMGVVALLSWIGVWHAFLPIDFIAILATLAGGYPVYKETCVALRHGKVNMEVSMTVAIVASLAVAQYTVSVVVTFFVLLSEYIETYALDKGRQTIILLEKSAPKRALVRRSGIEIEVDTQTLEPNDIVIVRDGERVPVDGTIVFGSAFVNQSMMTGESARVEKNSGDTVYAGSVNESGIIEVRTDKVGSETLFGKIIKLVEEAESKKAPIQKTSDRLATWLVEFAIGFSVLTFVFTRNVTSTLSVIVVAGACGVAAGTPLAIVAIMGKAAKRGAIVKGGVYVEEMSRIDTVVIDKTGTLTFGMPVVTDVTAVDNCDTQQVLQIAVTAERYLNHPIAGAIVEKASELGVRGIAHSTFSYTPGKGVAVESEGHNILVGNGTLLREKGVAISPEALSISTAQAAQGKTAVYVAHENRICGLIAVADRIRDESRKAMADLRNMKVKTIMLTGDNKVAAQIVANEVGIDEVYAELLPGDKVAFVEKLVAEGHRVAMVGDGINDAPALARANVGIGMGAGTDVAIEEADIVLITNDLQKIADVARLSRKAYRTIMTNFYGTITVDGIGVTLAFLGFLSPLFAAGIHVVSELIFILNSARLIR